MFLISQIIRRQILCTFKSPKEKASLLFYCSLINRSSSPLALSLSRMNLLLAQTFSPFIGYISGNRVLSPRINLAVPIQFSIKSRVSSSITGVLFLLSKGSRFNYKAYAKITIPGFDFVASNTSMKISSISVQFLNIL